MSGPAASTPKPASSPSKTSARRRIPTTDPRVAVAYLRVSTEEQHLGPEAQRASIEAWATREGVTVAHWSEDRISGGAELDAREGLTDAMDAIVRNRAGVLVVAKRDRLARDVVIAAMIERVASGRGARVVSADGVGNGDQPADAFMRTIIDAAAAYERALIRARTKAALAAKRRQGMRAGTVPWGYSADAEGRLVVNGVEANTMARARELRSAGVSLAKIAEQLTAEGHRGRSGSGFVVTQVVRMLADADRALRGY